jgi:hypothetical protein
LLVATTILTFVMTGVYLLFNNTVRLWRTLEQDFDSHQDARTSLSIFSREWDNAVWQAGYLMEGSDDELSFITVAEPMDVEEGEGRHMMQVRYYYNRSGGELIREERLVELSLPKWPQGGKSRFDAGRLKLGRRQRYTIASNVSEFKISYYWTPAPDPGKIDQPPEWVNHYIVAKHEQGWGLPQGIEVALTMVDPEDPKEEVAIHYRQATHTNSALRMDKHLRKMLEGLV